jgi:hypothetical protein
LALQAVMEATDLPIYANEIQVHPPRFAQSIGLPMSGLGSRPSTR